MILARVEGSIVATKKHPSFQGWRLLICQPIDRTGTPEGVPIIALDPHGAGLGQQVIVSSDGMAARQCVKDNHSPARLMIIGLVDDPVQNRDE